MLSKSRCCLLSAFVVALLGSYHEVDGADRPNVILVMCDDLGYGDLRSFHPSSPIKTPHLDAMAANGLRFNRFYAAAPVCSPTRGSCLTGRHPYRYGIYSANRGHLPKEELTLPELLKDQGYTCGHFGKWHLGTLTTTVKDANRGGPQGKEHFSPPSWHGYDDSFVTESKVPTYDPMIKPPNASGKAWDALTDKSKGVAYGTRYWDHRGAEVTENLEGDDSRIVMDRASVFIEDAANRNQPFLAVIWFHAPHLPVVASKEHRQPYSDQDVYHRNYYGCVSAIDDQIGRLRQQLRQLGVADETMVWFCSDNGPEGQAKNAPGSAGKLRGRKRSLYEGGVRVPAILEWPNHVDAGQTDTPVVTSDYLPTILDVIGCEYPLKRELDGVSIKPLLDGDELTRDSPIGFQSAKQIAWHENNFKLYSDDAGKTWELYDLVGDVGEQNDLASVNKQRVLDMVARVKEWQASCKASDEGNDY